MNEEFQAMQVTLEGIKIGAELSAKAVRTLQNLFLAIGSNLKHLAINRADKKLLNAKGQVDSKKIFKMTKDVAFLKLEDSKLDLFLKNVKNIMFQLLLWINMYIREMDIHILCIHKIQLLLLHK